MILESIASEELSFDEEMIIFVASSAPSIIFPSTLTLAFKKSFFYHRGFVIGDKNLSSLTTFLNQKYNSLSISH